MKCWLGKLRLYFSNVPSLIEDGEKIAKIVFHPFNVNENGKINAGAFRNKGDDLSVNRLNYTTLSLCKCQGLELRQNEKDPNIKRKKNILGLAVLFVREVRIAKGKVRYSPIPGLMGNKAHAEIVTGLGPKGERGEAEDSEYNYITNQIAKSAKIFMDTDGFKRKWVCHKTANDIKEYSLE